MRVFSMTTISKTDLYRLLPSVDELLHSPELQPLLEQEGQPAVADAARVVVAKLREEIGAGRLASAEEARVATAELSEAIARQLRSAMEFSLKPVINATGVI